MSQIIAVIESLIEPFGLALILTYGYCIIERRQDLGAARPILLGAMFGLAALFSMHSPIVVSQGVYVDLRNLFLGISAAIFGPVAGIVTYVIAVSMRVYMGGAGVILGISALSITLVMGLVWRQFVKQREIFHWKHWAVLGALISLHMVVALWLPPVVRLGFFTKVAPVLAIFQVIGAISLGWLLTTEGALARQTRLLEQAAATDPLTNLLNRRSVERAVDVMDPPKSNRLGRAMLTFDVDHFKQFNDKHGHAVGDAVLQAVTARVRSCLRPEDIFCRLGGDEFLIVLPEVTLDAARIVSERCREAVMSYPITCEDGKVTCTISLGVEWTRNPPAFAEHLAAADKALYRAKAMGRNRVAFASMPQAA